MRAQFPLLAAAFIFGVSLAYAVLRYHLVGDAPWSQLPLYTTNKAAAVTALAMAALALWAGLACRNLDALAAEVPRRHAKSLGLGAAFFSLWHAAASAVVLRPAYFAKLFGDNGTLTGWGETSMLAGVLAFAMIASVALTSSDQRGAANGRARWVFGSIALVALHAAAMGFPTWLAPASWPGGMPPLTLLSTAFALLALIWMLSRFANKRSGRRHPMESSSTRAPRA